MYRKWCWRYSRANQKTTKKQLLQYDKENLEAKSLILIIYVRVIHF